METKKNADVIIGGKVYTLSGYESEEYLHKVAGFINKKIDELSREMGGYNHLANDTKALLLQLNLTDEYFKTKEKAEMLEADMEENQKVVSDLRHEIIGLQIKIDTQKDTIEDLEARIKELTHVKEQLEKSLDEALLGKGKY